MVTESLSERIESIERELEAVKRKVSDDRKRFEEAAGSWSGFDADKFKDRIREDSEESQGGKKS